MGRMAAVDAQTYWMAAKIPSDQFLLYAFGGPVPDPPLDRLRERALSCPELRLRVHDGGIGYPRWVRGDVAADQFVVHAGGLGWPELLTAVARLTDDQLDPRIAAWRLHVFPDVSDIPEAGAGVVAVLQVAHALADGVRSSALAAWLFGRDAPVAPVAPPRPLEALTLPWRAYRAARTHRQLVRDTAVGVVAPPPDSCPVRSCNNRPEGQRRIRTVVRRRARIAGPTVTVGVLAAVADALAGHLRELGEDPSRLGAEVPMTKSGPRHAHNHFGNVAVGLHPELPFAQRAARIADELELRRRRAAHPAMAAADRAFAATPGPLLRWGVGQFDPTLRSPTVTGNTVLSSVNRGPADLRFGSAAAVLTAGFPALSPMMGLTHGVHGIGDTVTISIYAAESAVADIDSYTARLAAALDP